MKKLFFSFLLIFQIIFSQTKEYTGTVVDEDNLPLPGVKILIKGTDIGTQSDFDGNFKINVPDSLNTLTFKYMDLKH